MDRKLNSAVPYLIDAIAHPRDINNRGTLVYALGDLDCSAYFLFLFALSFDPSFEVASESVKILKNGSFSIRRNDLLLCEQIIGIAKRAGNPPEHMTHVLNELTRILKRLQRNLTRPKSLIGNVRTIPNQKSIRR